MNFITKYKKLLLIFIFIFIVIILGYLLYALFLKPQYPTPPISQPSTTTPGQLPISGIGEKPTVGPTGSQGLPGGDAPTIGKKANPVAQGGLTVTTALNDTPSFGVTLSDNGSDLQYYNKDNGKFYRIDKYGEVSPLSDKIFHNIENITWSPNKNKAILEYPDGANIIYNFDTQKQITLPKHWKDFNFSANGDKIVMKSMGIDPANRWLAITNDDGSKVRAIEPLGEKDATVYPSWSPNNQMIAMFTEGIDFDRQEVYFVGLNNENFKSTVIEGRGFQPKWSPEGERLLYSVYSSKNDLKPNLWVVNAQGDNIGAGRKNLKIETWADKCTYANNSEIYCAVPKNLEEGAGLFPELARNTEDRLFKINTNSGLKKLIAVPDGSYNISKIILSDDSRYLYFTDEATGKIHKINLK